MKKRPIGWIIPILILSLIAFFWIMFSDFGGVYWRNSYLGIDNWRYLNLLHPVSGPFIAIVLLLLLTVIILMIISLASRGFGSRKGPYVATLILIGAVFFISFVGMIALAIAGSDYDDWWFDDACYVGNIAPFLLIPLTLVALIRVSIWKRKAKNEE